MTPRRINLGDTVRVRDRWQGLVTGTMTLQPATPNPVIKRSVCVQIVGRTDGLPSGRPVWVPVEDVVLVAKAAK